jgi:hypothetical protein
MSKGPKPKSPKPLTFDQAASELPAARARARSEAKAFSEAYEQAILQLHLVHGIMARAEAKSKSALRRVDELRAVVDAGEGKLGPAFELVPNPMITQGLLDAVASGEVETPHQASIMAAKNHVVLVGGLARVKGKTEAQFLAASKYCHLFECAQIGRMQATDYSQVRVDTSGPRQDQISASQDSSRAELAGARHALGPHAASIVDQVVIFGESVRSLAKKLGLGEGGQGRRRAEKELLAALDVLVKHFNLLPRENAKSTMWRDGSQPKIIRTSQEDN